MLRVTRSHCLEQFLDACFNAVSVIIRCVSILPQESTRNSNRRLPGSLGHGAYRMRVVGGALWQGTDFGERDISHPCDLVHTAKPFSCPMASRSLLLLRIIQSTGLIPASNQCIVYRGSGGQTYSTTGNSVDPSVGQAVPNIIRNGWRAPNLADYSRTGLPCRRPVGRTRKIY